MAETPSVQMNPIVQAERADGSVVAEKGVMKTERGKKATVSARAIPVVIETDVGHDCDDIEALQLALADHKLGTIRILYIGTVSQNNVQRCRLVQYLCALYGIEDIPLIPSHREEATRAGAPISRCKMVFQYTRVGDKYVPIPTSPSTAQLFPQQKLCPIADPTRSSQIKASILAQHTGVRVLVIGPGIETETFSLLEELVGEETKMSTVVDRIVWQGNYGDKGSFNVGSDHEAASEMQEWTERHDVKQFNIGKKTAYSTHLGQDAFGRLAALASSLNVDLQAMYQLGVMEFRDASRNLFNCLNFGVSSPGQSPPPFLPKAQAFDPQVHREVEEVLTQDSHCTKWFESLPQLPPMYDVTAYLLLRDTMIDRDVEPECRWYELVGHGGIRWSVGAGSSDNIKLDGREYLAGIEGELSRAISVCCGPIEAVTKKRAM